MSSQGPNDPTAFQTVASGGTVDWTNPGNSGTSDNTYATAAGSTATSYLLYAQSFGFTIPSGTRIDGFVVEIERSSPDSILDSNVRLIRGDGISYSTNNKADSLNFWPGADAYKTYGSSSDTWGDPDWSYSEVNDADFGVAIAVTIGLASTAKIDHIRVTVYYSTGWDASQFLMCTQSRALPLPPPRRTVCIGVTEPTMMSDQQPNNAWYGIRGKSITPPPLRAPGAKVVRPELRPSDELPELGWKQFVGERGRFPTWRQNQTKEVSGAIPGEIGFETWAFVGRRRVILPPLTRLSQAFLVQPMSGPTMGWAFKGLPGRMPQRAGQSGRFTPPSVPSDPETFWWNPVLASGTKRAVKVRRPPLSLQPLVDLDTRARWPLVPIVGRQVQPLRRGSSLFVRGIAEAVGYPSMTLARGVRPRPFVPSQTFTPILEPTGTSIETDLLVPTLIRPVFRIVYPWQRCAVFETLLEISTATRKDNRNSSGAGMGATSTGGSGLARTSTGVGTQG